MIDPEDLTKIASPGKLGKRKGSAEYYKAEAAAYKLANRRMAEMPVLPSENGCLDIPGEYKPPETGTKKRKRFTNVSPVALSRSGSIRMHTH